MKHLNEAYQKYQSYKEHYNKGYNLAKEIDELVTLYGRKNFIKGYVRDEDEKRLEDVTNDLIHMYYDGIIKCFFMSAGFQQYQNKTAWKRLKEKIRGDLK